MRIDLNYDLCESNALCMDECPEVFHIEDDETLSIRKCRRLGRMWRLERPAVKLQEKVRKAARRCPRGAITLGEED